MHFTRKLGGLGPSGVYTYYHPEIGAKKPLWRSALLYIAVVGLASAAVAAGAGFKANQWVNYSPNTALVQSAQAEIPPEQQPQPAVALAPQPTDQSAELQAVLDNWAATHSPKQWSVVVKGLGNNVSSASVAGDSSFAAASIYKLFLVYPLFQTYTLDSLVTNHVTVVGRGTVSLKTCVELMLKVSDNPCGDAVGSKLGWARSTTALKQIGLTSTNLSNAQGPTTTASDTTLFLQKLYAGEILDGPSKQYVLDLMRVQRLRQGIPAGCSGCVVADKTGDLGYVRHDAGVVEYGGGAYTLSIFTNGASYAQIAELTAQIQAKIAAQP